MNIDLNKFRETFFVEAEEHLETMESALLTLETTPDDPELLNQIFRAAHTIKGASSTFGVEEVSRFTHVLENLLDRLRAGELTATPDLLELLLNATDVLTALIEAEKNQTDLPEEKEDVLQRLKIANGMDADHQEDEAAVESDAAPTDSLEYRIKFVPSENFFRFGLNPLLVIEEIDELGEVTACIPDLRQLKPFPAMNAESCYVAWNIEFEGAVSKDKLLEVAMFFDEETVFDVTPVNPPAPEPQTDPEPQPAAAAPPAAAQGEEAAAAPPAAAPKAKKAPVKVKDSVRVDRERLDNLINQIGELVIGTSMVEQEWYRDNQHAESAALNQLGKIVRDLQEMSLSLRMVPIAATFQKMARLVRDLGKKLDKKIRFETEGEKSELDKTVVDKIGDPLLHMVRNSVDHGIETAEERLAAGKPEEGRVCLRAFHQGGNFIIQIEDDGRGLNREKIFAKALERGLVSEGDKLSDEEINGLIFQPGFSTAAAITDVSGRGVGMDVVRRNVEALQGSISVQSTTGKGTLVTIRLPLTLAILDGLIIRSNQQVYVIPLLSVVESICPSKKDIKKILGKGEVIQLRGEVVPLLRLNSLLAVRGEPVPVDTNSLLVIVEDQGRKFAISVDELVGQQQVVIKNLETNFQKVPGMAGATILGDGRVALILDVNCLGTLKASTPSHGNNADAETNGTAPKLINQSDIPETSDGSPKPAEDGSNSVAPAASDLSSDLQKETNQ